MKKSIKKGFGFGLTSGIITTLGMIVGLNSVTGSSLAVIGGIIVISIADAMSDALGMHISEETTRKKSDKFVWESTFSTFFFKFIFALSFIIPFLFFNLSIAIYISIVWGLLILSLFSVYLAKQEKIKPYKVVIEHISIAIVVIIITNYVGKLVASIF
ncbi:hypothetical protein HN865_01155 [Candidatus Woesearchaeota archaeon]|jgi:vacuolar iron transporter family protein|nr:hypothetical protein [Candidatus Woesearchaeota archaeon]MBT7237444.1 hypothetical protein [Candidatus Woesearchaeota archaeon]